MTPSFYYEGDWLFRAQLRCLSEQTNKNFHVLVIDSHYLKRKSYIGKLAEHYGLDIIHVPYYPNEHIAKKLDCSIFNAPYCFSESERIVRYSCWRFVRPNFTDVCINSRTNVDFYFHSIEPDTIDNFHPNTSHHTGIWEMHSDVVHWSKIPNAGQAGATWTCHSETDAPEALFPANAYGNYMVFREQWININGCEEHFNTTHFEDMDFTIRAANAQMTCERKALIMYRLHHLYGGHSGRSNIPTDIAFKKPCEKCENASHEIEPNRYDLKKRIQNKDVEIIDDKWICKACYLSGAVYHADAGEYTTALKNSGKTKSTINPKYKIGRNLSILISDMDGKSLEEKINIYKDSWTNPRYYER